MTPLTTRERRLLAVGILVLCIGLIWLAIVGPLVGGFLDRAEQRREMRAAYQRNERIVASLPALRATVEAQRRTAQRFEITAASEPLAVEALKERLQRLATEEGFAVKAIDDLQADAPSGSIKIRADLTLSLNQMYEMLRRLESEDAYVVVDYLSVTADRSAAAGRLAPIDVRLELSADWRPLHDRS